MVSGRDACNSDPFGPQKVENLLVVKLGPVSAIQGKGRRDQAHSAPSLCVSWERAALSCVLCNRGQMTSHLSSLRSPSAQKPLISASIRNRLNCTQCLQHPWLMKDTKNMEAKKLSKDRMKKYMARRKWQVCGLHGDRELLFRSALFRPR